MKRKMLALIMAGTLCALQSTAAWSAPEDTTDEKRKCKELIENSQDVPPSLYTEVLNCELNIDDEFAAAGGLVLGSTDLTRQLITGGDITTTTFNEPGPTPGPSCGAGTGVPCPLEEFLQ